VSLARDLVLRSAVGSAPQRPDHSVEVRPKRLHQAVGDRWTVARPISTATTLQPSPTISTVAGTGKTSSQALHRNWDGRPSSSSRTPGKSVMPTLRPSVATV